MASSKHQYLLSFKNPIGKNFLGDAVKNHIQQLIEEEWICDGNYSNTSLRKGLMDHLLKAGVPTSLADACMGHYCTNAGTAKAGYILFLCLFKRTFC